MLKRISALMLVLLIAMAAFSCEDEADEDVPDTTLTGVWECLGYTLAGTYYAYPTEDGLGITTDFTEEWLLSYTTVDTGSTKTVNYCNEDKYEYSITDGNIITFTNKEDDVVSGPYSIDGNIMLWEQNGVEYKYEKVDDTALDGAMDTCRK